MNCRLYKLSATDMESFIQTSNREMRKKILIFTNVSGSKGHFLQHSVRMFVGTFKSQKAGAIVMYDGSNSTSTGQVFNFIHYWKNWL